MFYWKQPQSPFLVYSVRLQQHLSDKHQSRKERIIFLLLEAGYGWSKKYPDMTTFTRARPFQKSRDIILSASIYKCAAFFYPIFFIEICHYKPGCIIW
jgi:hypothetical protein